MIKLVQITSPPTRKEFFLSEFPVSIISNLPNLLKWTQIECDIQKLFTQATSLKMCIVVNSALQIINKKFRLVWGLNNFHSSPYTFWISLIRQLKWVLENSYQAHCTTYMMSFIYMEATWRFFPHKIKNEMNTNSIFQKIIKIPIKNEYFILLFTFFITLICLRYILWQR